MWSRCVDTQWRCCASAGVRTTYATLLEESAADRLAGRLDDIGGTVVTFDAPHTTGKRMETVVVEKRADYPIRVKGNTPAPLESLVRAFEKESDQRRIVEDYVPIIARCPRRSPKTGHRSARPQPRDPMHALPGHPMAHPMPIPPPRNGLALGGRGTVWTADADGCTVAMFVVRERSTSSACGA